MLKALELSGFKSFADKTRFEFPPGITVVVGPNGSGKSNIVDAIKWVLGEQSAKSLRGKEMSDVIFKGSSGRKVLNTAEATIVIDNSEGQLSIDAPEIHVTRRVYRSGEGEYLINGQPSRLKDVRNLFRGTGVGTDAYSLIEQGKVDRLLQASPKDRRAIFEEAAGISRFKAKKIETQRRLERVEQNLLRLSDIVEEVENRLRSVRAQAKKAQRYREHRDRLQQLRTQVGLTDWRVISVQLAEFDEQAKELEDESNGLAARSEEVEARGLSLETQGIECDEVIRVAEAKYARTIEQIAARESTVAGERQICRDLEQQLRRNRRDVALLMNDAVDLEVELEATSAELDSFQAEFTEAMSEVAFLDEAVQQLDRDLDRMRSSTEGQRAHYVDQMREMATLNNQLAGAETQLEAADEAGQRIRLLLGEIESRLHDRHQKLATAEQAAGKLAASESDLREKSEKSAAQLVEQRRLLTRRHEEQAHLQGRLRGANERLAVLLELEQKLQGLSAGVKQVLSLDSAEGETSLAKDEIQGLVADLIESKSEHANLIDLALGERAQFVVLSGSQFADQLVAEQLKLDGRVGFLRLSQLGPKPSPPNLKHDEAVVGRADELVETAAEFNKLIHNLLGDTWIVTDLQSALRLWRGPGRGCRFVTRNAEMVDFDGAIVMGPQHASLGLLARRSELRDLRAHIEDIESRLAAGEQELARLLENIDSQELEHQQSVEEFEGVQRTLAGSRIQIDSWRDQVKQLDRERQVADQELHAKHAMRRVAEEESNAVRSGIESLQSRIEEIEQSIQAADAQLDTKNSERQQRQLELTAGKVEFARREQRLETLQSQMQRFQQDQADRSSRLEEAQRSLQRSTDKLRSSERHILSTTSELALFYLDKERFVEQARAARDRRADLLVERSQLNDESTKLRKQEKRCEDRQHKCELEAERLRQQRSTLAERLRDDYGIEIHELDGGDESPEDLEQREEVEAEIADLRRKISNIGAVNLDALGELDDLETRFNALSEQYEDLRNAKETLGRIIQQINTDSRRLFVETLEVIRANFQVLYRKAFGGGKADIVMEEGVDVLEAGVDIMATPPGKPSFSNSLLSGGEKALTAVALLLAIFEFRPSPFCVLDEVDAPFDEANIGRFVDVLNGFLGWTKFVIVTHSKKTMTAAHTLYGVTMQESGVSKQVSVRFEDVSDDGEIRQQAG